MNTIENKTNQKTNNKPDHNPNHDTASSKLNHNPNHDTASRKLNHNPSPDTTNRPNTRVLYITQAAIIAALYVVMTYIARLAGLASGAIQVRISEALCTLVLFTPAAVPGMTVGCLLANILTNSVALDIGIGPIATLIGAYIGWRIRKYRYLIPIPTILSNAIIVPIVLIFGYGEEAAYPYLFATVGLGEIIAAGIMGIILMRALLRVPQFRSMVE